MKKDPEHMALRIFLFHGRRKRRMRIACYLDS